MAFSAVALGHGGHAVKGAEPDKRRPVDPAASVDEIWKARCEACHKTDGRGKPEALDKQKRVPDLGLPAWHDQHDDDAARASIENGVEATKMRAFKGKMTDAQLKGVVAKIRSFRRGSVDGGSKPDR